jgi:alpha-beta hydrolase superfamily lysophospholipase
MSRVFLIHGMGRTPASMWVLDRRLRGAGYRPSLFGYFVTVSDLEEIAGRFAAHVGRVVAADAERSGAETGYAVVSHSLGGVVARLAAPRLPPGLSCCVMLAPPNRPPAAARALAENPVFRLLTQDAGRKINDPEFFAGLPVPEVPLLVVAGTRGPRAAWLPHGGRPNDSVLQVDETRLEGAATVTVHGVHTFLMNRKDVFDAVRSFFAATGFAPAAP